MTRVLVVDDEIDTLNLLRTILEISGYEAFTTLNSLDALTLAEVERPDLILLDIMMPNLDGFTLCKMMRNHPTTKDLPIVFVTAYSALDLEERRADAGADMVLPKPIGMDTLIDAVDKATAIRKSGAPAEAGTASAAGSPGVIMISLDDQPVIQTPPAVTPSVSPETAAATSATATATHAAVPSTESAPATPAAPVAPTTPKPAASDEITFSIGGEEPAPPAPAAPTAPATPAAPAPPATPPADTTASASTTSTVTPPVESKPAPTSDVSSDKPTSDTSQPDKPAEPKV